MIKKTITLLVAMVGLTAGTLHAQNERCSIKLSADIGLGDAYSIEPAEGSGMNAKSNSNSFNAVFGYRAWTHGRLSLGVNGGLSYSTGSQTLSVNEMEFDYMAPATADMDNETYRRYTTVRDARQKISVSEIGIPIYVDLDIKLHKRLSVYALVGVRPQISISSKTSSLEGQCDVYGVYPQYGNLKIDDASINDFGNRPLDKEMAESPDASSFMFNLMAGAGLRVWLAGPISLECGIGYEHGFTDRFKCDGSDLSQNITAENAPVTYTVEGGRKVRPFTSYLKKDRLSGLSLSIGLIYRF